MGEKITIVNIEGGDQPVEELKLVVASLMTQWEDSIIESEIPQDIDFDSKQEYEEAVKEYQLELLDEIKKAKHDIFASVLESYNQLLAAKYKRESVVKDQDRRSQDLIDKANSDIKSASLVTLGLSLFIPAAMPYLLLFNLPRIGTDIYLIKYHQKRISSNRVLDEQIKKIQDPMFEFMDTLRDDYHASNKELKELKEKAENGENIMAPLLEMIKPERVHLQRSDFLKQIQVEMDESKELVKRDNN
jgi:hypothetical protein